ncbi:hypothetical protein DIE11_17465 [Burkholderia sp. Bp9012]|uniref:hypothetical protein n=1 Tax=Burkholderia sp. Bp9012 TaxID=2184562 RepID=UPI000F5A2D0B|nr:hypothetical protein [Burkholderia sp. Bp9012]RQR79184.1 hypothetical protein DIE11_17465 [Burkholderia sp. Bp9012]
MTMPLPQSGTPRLRLPLLVACAWGTLVSAGVVIDYLLVSGIATRVAHVPRVADMDGLHREQTALEQRVTALSHPVDIVRRADLRAAQKATDARLSKLEQAIDARAASQDLAALQTRLGQLDAEVAAQHVKPDRKPVRRPRPVAAPVPTPPFTVLGTELRGGEGFLAVAPSVNAPIDQTTLLHPGDATAGWQLQTIDGSTAIFRANGQTVRLDIPGRTP